MIRRESVKIKGDLLRSNTPRLISVYVAYIISTSKENIHHKILKNGNKNKRI